MHYVYSEKPFTEDTKRFTQGDLVLCPDPDRLLQVPDAWTVVYSLGTGGWLHLGLFWRKEIAQAFARALRKSQIDETVRKIHREKLKAVTPHGKS